MSANTSISDVMEYIVSGAAPNLPANALADIFDRLIWCLTDNGKELLIVRDAWLQGEDLRRVEIALAMEETFPMGGGLPMESILKAISSRWPQLTRGSVELSLTQ